MNGEVQEEFGTHISKYVVLRSLFDSKVGDTIQKGDLLTIDEVSVNLETGTIVLTFEEEHYLCYQWSEEAFEIIGFKAPNGKIIHYKK